jgi:hypothetical protein
MSHPWIPTHLWQQPADNDGPGESLVVYDEDLGGIAQATAADGTVIYGTDPGPHG